MKTKTIGKPDCIYIDKGFVDSVSLISSIEQTYKCKQFEKALFIIKDSLNEINIPSLKELSIYFDIIASILWKIGQKESAYNFWKKSFEIDKNNRHSQLSLSILFNDKTNNYFDLFIRIKFNEFYSSKKLFEKFKCDDKFYYNYLIDYWTKNLSGMNFNNFEETDLAEIFINIKLL